MRRTALLALILLFPSVPSTGEGTAAKERALEVVDRQAPALIELADRLWSWAEIALEETRSSKALADYAEAKGFRVERGVAGMPTAFVASYGEGRPVIGVMGEYDALPGLSQKASPAPEPAEQGAAGHGCGHNLFGPASLGAAVAVKELIERGELEGTIRFYGTPAEEAVGGKLYMVRAGLFDDVDVALAWHPSDEIRADADSSQAMVDMEIMFQGRTAHAAYDPWNARDAADAAEVFTFALNLMREHVRPTVRMHYVVTEAGQVPNVIPERARVWCWLRDSEHAGVNELLERVRRIAEGAALATDTEVTVRIQTGDWEMLPNLQGAQLLHENLLQLGPLQFTDEEQAFASRIQEATGVEPIGLRGQIEPLEVEVGEPEGGSTDVADVSWMAPTLHLSVTTAAAGAPWHAWPVVATGGMSIGHKGMLYASRALAATMVDLFQQPDRREAIRAEFERRRQGVVYESYLPEGPPPIP